MSTALATPGPSTIQDWVIDNDTHISEPPDLFTSRLPRKWHDRAPTIRRNEERGFEVWVMGDQQQG